MQVLRKLTIQRLMVAVLFVVLFAMAVRVPVSADTWWHLRSGELIAESGEIPRTDTFSHTRSGADWIDHSWGAQLILHGFYELPGGGSRPGTPGNIGLALYVAVLATAGMALVYAMCEGSVYPRAFVVLLGAVTAAVFWSPRPQMFSFLLAALVLYLLHLYKRHEVDRLWLIPPVMVLWANLHGGFAIGFILLAGTLVGEGLGTLLDGDDPRVVSGRRLGKLALVSGIAVPAVSLNPYGPRLLVLPFQTVSIGVLQDYIHEWSSPNFHQMQVWPFALLLLGVLALPALSPRRIDWTDLTLTLGTAIMALTAGRNIAVFALVATPVLSRHLDAWLAGRGWQFKPVTRTEDSLWVFNWILLIVIIAGGLVKIAYTLNAETVRRVQREHLPVEAAAFIAQTPLPGHMFNSYNWGGYLLFAAPEVPVYVDGRTDLYTDDVLEEYLDVVFLRDEWRAVLDRRGIGYVVIEAESGLATMLRSQADTWQEFQFDEGRSSVFVRTAGAVTR